MSKHFESRFKGLIGSYHSMKKALSVFGYRRSPGLTLCKQVLVKETDCPQPSLKSSQDNSAPNLDFWQLFHCRARLHYQLIDS